MKNAMKSDRSKSYWSHEVAKLLDISTSTLRKWSLALEAEGYEFVRDENGRRAYLERDIMPLQKMRELLNDGKGMEDAAKAVVLHFSEQISNTGTVVVLDENERSSERYLELIQHNKRLFSLLEHLEEKFEEKLEEQNKILQQQFEDQQKYIEETLERRDQYLMQALEKMLEKRRKKPWQFWRK